MKKIWQTCDQWVRGLAVFQNENGGGYIGYVHYKKKNKKNKAKKSRVYDCKMQR